MRRVSQRSRTADGLCGERGSMAVIAILGMALLLVITVAFVALAQLETKIGVNHAQAVQATQAGEAGARRVFREIADGTETGAQWVAKSQPVRTGTLTGGSYSVTVVTSSTANNVAVQSTGTSGGARAVVTLLVSPTSYPQHAMDMGGYLKVNGSPHIGGSQGSVYVYTSGTDMTDATVDIDVSGHPVVAQGMATDSTPSVSTNGTYCKIAGCSPALTPDTGAASQPIPAVDPTKYSKYADFILNNDGYAYLWTSTAVDPGSSSALAACPSRSPAACISTNAALFGWSKLPLNDGGTTYALGDCVKGWQWGNQAPSSTKEAFWKDCATGIVNGTYYVRGGVTFSHDHSASPTHTTLITEYYINASQSIAWTGDNGSGYGPNPTFPRDILMVAGGDIILNNPVSVRGVIASHEQIQLNNGGSITGMLIAEDVCEGLNTGWPTCDTTVKFNTVNGSPTITYNGDMQPAGLGTAASVTKWLGL